MDHQDNRSVNLVDQGLKIAGLLLTAGVFWLLGRAIVSSNNVALWLVSAVLIGIVIGSVSTILLMFASSNYLMGAIERNQRQDERYARAVRSARLEDLQDYQEASALGRQQPKPRRPAYPTPQSVGQVFDPTIVDDSDDSDLFQQWGAD